MQIAWVGSVIRLEDMQAAVPVVLVNCHVFCPDRYLALSIWSFVGQLRRSWGRLVTFFQGKRGAIALIQKIIMSRFHFLVISWPNILYFGWYVGKTWFVFC